MLMERVRNCLKRLSPRLRHEYCADTDGYGAGAGEEEVDAKGGLGQKDRRDEGDKEVGNLNKVSKVSLWRGGHRGGD